MTKYIFFEAIRLFHVLIRWGRHIIVSTSNSTQEFPLFLTSEALQNIFKCIRHLFFANEYVKHFFLLHVSIFKATSWRILLQQCTDIPRDIA